MAAMRLVLAVAPLLLPLAGASSSSSVPAHTTVARVTAAVPADQPPSKLVVFVVENHSLPQMRTQMPFTSRLATRYGYATGYRAVTHPSLPNYLAITTGSTHGIRDDGPPSAHPVTGPSVFGQALENGKTARLYAEGRLPDAGMVIPDLCHDAHDCAFRSADRWLRPHVNMVMSGDDWASGRLVEVITADEDDHDQDDRDSQMLGATPFDQAQIAASLTRALGVPVSHTPRHPSVRHRDAPAPVM